MKATGEEAITRLYSANWALALDVTNTNKLPGADDLASGVPQELTD